MANRCAIGRRVAVTRPWEATDLSAVSKALQQALEMLEVECAKRGIELPTDAEELPPGRSDALVERATRWACAAGQWLATAPLGEAREVVGWYHTMIPPKLHRAFTSRDDGVDDDAMGSAKVATLGLSRVVHELAAHCRVLSVDRPGMDLLLEACALIEEVEKTFPGHLSFRRPGLD